MSQLFGISIEIEQLRDSVGLTQRRVDVHMTVTTPRCEILVSQFVEGDDLNDGLSVGPGLNRELVEARLAEDNHVALSMTTDEKLTFFTRLIHRADWLVRFNCVGDALSELVPHFERVIETGCEKLVTI